MVIMAVAAVLAVNAQSMEKTVTMYGERPQADLYRDPSAPKSTSVMEISPAEKDYAMPLVTQGVPVEYWYKYTAKETYLVILTGKNEKITFWFKNASDKAPKIDWNAAVISFTNGTSVTIKYDVDLKAKIKAAD